MVKLILGEVEQIEAELQKGVHLEDTRPNCYLSILGQIAILEQVMAQTPLSMNVNTVGSILNSYFWNQHGQKT